MTSLGIDKSHVDPSCPEKMKPQVHIHKIGDQLMTYTLNINNLETNSNKYMVVQLLKHDTMNSYFLLVRGGRVGSENKTDFKCYLNLDKAVADFQLIFLEKTGVKWEDRRTATQKAGKYAYIVMGYEDAFSALERKTSESGDRKEADPVEVEAEFKMSDSVKFLISMIYDMKMIQTTAQKYGYNTAQAPLGAVSTAQINRALSILGQISDLIQKATPPEDRQYVLLSSNYYSIIPTMIRGKLPPITTVEQVKEKEQTLEFLSSMETYSKIMKTPTPDSRLIYQQYLGFNCELSDTRDINLIYRYVTETHGRTHKSRLGIRHVFTVNRRAERAPEYDLIDKVGNRHLLWHGSRVSNFIGILNQGLRIAPPEAPSTGYMFGKGLYFANCVSKSAKYMHPENGLGLILLCEVALGQPLQLTSATNVTRLPKDYQSVWGVGSNTPDPSGCQTTSDGLVVPSDATLVYDEFIVYNVHQVRMRYLIVMDVA